MEKARLVLVSYLNTLPFVDGLRGNSHLFDVQKATPAVCASVFENGAADIALVPVGALPELKDYRIISDYCIGCEGAVRTVVVFSHRPLTEIRRLYLDEDSRTSARLVRILFERHLALSVDFIDGIPEQCSDSGAAYLMIGDKVFDYEGTFSYTLDLGSAWKAYSGLPFAFAVWICRSDLDVIWESRLNDCLRTALEQRPLKSYPHQTIDLDEYFSRYISYDLDEDKRKAIDRFLALI